MDIQQLIGKIEAILPEFSIREGGKTAVKIRNELQKSDLSISLDDVKSAIAEMQRHMQINSYRHEYQHFHRYTQPCPV